ncbi:GTP cyclohydrolase FolE2 [Sutterella sp.]|uniref:GTP cyclohydrolase FolE2 n=1 Tax=Sutterella sp. TaxID=1981025 RepID=UPI0026DF5A93|nr:GTP cyclohydrolase FolE2 [Sutterella sp.]MDO5530502.1 GTP cyclohydrolase FolE2 [Sutterella sp.]
MEAEFSQSLPDVQSTGDERQIAIDRVGVRGIELPVLVAGRDGPQHTIASVTMTVALPADKKGTHMSRFVALMEDHREPLDADSVRSIYSDMLERLQAVEGTIEIRFPFFVRKAAPVSKLESILNYRCAFIVTTEAGGTVVRQEAQAPVTSLCPCSKEISRYGAHNQRSLLKSTVILAAPMSFEEQIAVAEASASCQLWSRLKRSDEKFVTEYAYDHPKFVEDIVRDMAKALNADERVLAYRVEAENFESIHNHSAYAYLMRDKRRP